MPLRLLKDMPPHVEVMNFPRLVAKQLKRMQKDLSERDAVKLISKFHDNADDETFDYTEELLAKGDFRKAEWSIKAYAKGQLKDRGGPHKHRKRGDGNSHVTSRFEDMDDGPPRPASISRRTPSRTRGDDRYGGGPARRPSLRSQGNDNSGGGSLGRRNSLRAADADNDYDLGSAAAARRKSLRAQAGKDYGASGRRPSMGIGEEGRRGEYTEESDSDDENFNPFAGRSAGAGGKARRGSLGAGLGGGIGRARADTGGRAQRAGGRLGDYYEGEEYTAPPPRRAAPARKAAGGRFDNDGGYLDTPRRPSLGRAAAARKPAEDSFDEASDELGTPRRPSLGRATPARKPAAGRFNNEYAATDTPRRASLGRGGAGRGMGGALPGASRRPSQPSGRAAGAYGGGRDMDGGRYGASARKGGNYGDFDYDY